MQYKNAQNENNCPLQLIEEGYDKLITLTSTKERSSDGCTNAREIAPASPFLEMTRGNGQHKNAQHLSNPAKPIPTSYHPKIHSQYILWGKQLIKTSQLAAILLLSLCFYNQKAIAQCPANPVVVSISTTGQAAVQSSYTVPGGGPYRYRITAGGGNGGGGGGGATMSGDFVLNTGQVLQAIAGGQGGFYNGTGGKAGGGGAGSGVQVQGGSALIVAGGGGGTGSGSGGGGGLVTNTGTNGGGSPYGGGGGGYLSDGGGGAYAGKAGFGGAGGNSNVTPAKGGSGFGGGGGGRLLPPDAGGGGGGYSGGDGGSDGSGSGGGGGGSYNIGTNQANTAGNNNGGGVVTIECMGQAPSVSFSATQPTCSTTGSLTIDLTGSLNGNTTDYEYAIVSGANFNGTPTYSNVTADPFTVTSGTGTMGSTTGNTYTVRVRLKSNTNTYAEYTYTLFANSIFYVRANASGANNGTSWANAYTSLQSALAAANSCTSITQIWVAAGTYTPTNGADRNASFVMRNNLAIYGGFNGTETLLSQRNIANNPTTLSGDLLGNDGANFANNGENSYHVINNYNNGLNSTAIIDGFTISGGNANASSTNATIIPNYFGGGMLNSASSPTISNCSFVGNSATNNATSGGGGMYNQNNSSPTLTNCSFSGNLSTGFGGGMHNFSSSPTLSNCSFSGNSASNGGGMINTTSVNSGIASNPILRNCIIWGNSSGVSNFGSSNSTYSYCLVEGINPGGTNFSGSLNPLFVSQPPIGLGTSGNLRLQNTSPVINVGSNVLNSSTTDLAGNPRIFGCTIDLGAYENQTVAASVLYVRANASGGNNGTSWANAFNSLQSALAATNSCTSITQIWVAAGTYTTTGSSFSMKNNLAIYGGFSGTENLLSQRNFATNTTILSGNNTTLVINNFSLNSSAILDGFTITGGNNSGNGGGMSNSTASPTISNCIFSGNSAVVLGGGMYNENNSSPSLTNCSFLGNSAGNGGGMCNFGGSSILTNCSFSGNNASNGGGMYNVSSSPSLRNCIIWGNSSGASNNSGSNPVYNYSLIQGLAAAGTNFSGSLDPLFVSQPAFSAAPTTTGNLRLQACSPVLNAGSNALNSSTLDLAGTPRIYNSGIIDLGAYELQAASTLVTAPATTTNNALSFDGNNDYVNISQCGVTNNQLSNGGTAITIEYFFKGSNIQSAVRLQAVTGGYVVAGYNGQHIISTDGGTNGVSVGNLSTVQDGNWHHIAFTWQKNTTNGFKSYLDGQLVAQRNAGNVNLPIVDQATLGSLIGQSEFTNGSLDEVRIWNVARTQAQIQASLCGSFSPAVQTGLVAYYSFDHGTANATNTVNTLANLAQPGLFNGQLNNFALTGTASNWVSPPTPPSILYVKANAGGANTGNSWANAFTSLQSALALAQNSSCITQIWVAAGTYKPAVFSRDSSFVMKNGLSILGGFPNSGNPTLANRNYATNVTILSGDLLGNDVGFANNGENSYHVILNSNNGLNSTAILDGFTISGGNASVANTNEGSGGGMRNSSATPAVSNCVFSGNTAISNGGGFDYGSNTNITLTNCSFIGNTAGNGGGIRSVSQLTLNNCNFTGNSAINVGGGILVLSGAALTNCSFSGNNASQGGGMYNSSSSTLTNCSFSGNNASNGGGMYNVSSSPSLRNCIIWGNSSGASNNSGSNPVYNYSLIQGLAAAGTNFSGSLDPLFVSQPAFSAAPTTTGNLRLQPCSPVLNGGLNSANISSFDLDGTPRIFGSTIDLGAYELQQSGAATIAPPFTTNNALHFDGSDDYVTITNNCPAPTLIINGGNEVTVEYWFKGSNLQSAVRLQPDNSTFIVPGWNGNSSNPLIHILSNDGGLSNGLPVGAAATDGNWHHVAMTWKRNTPNNGFISYLDGQIVAQRGSSNNALPVISSGITLGNYNNGEYTNGSLDEVRIWSIARTQAQIQAGICGSTTAPQANLVAYYNFNHGAAGGSNGSISTLANTAQPGTFTGVLNNFDLSTGNTSNWITSTAAPVAASIVTSPANQSIVAGANTSFTVTAAGSGLSYQWQVNTGGGFSNIINGGVYSNATTPTLNITPGTQAMDGYTYQCVVSPVCGSAATSGMASLSVCTVPIAPAFTTNNALNFNENNQGYVAINTTCGGVTPIFPGGDAITIEYWFKGNKIQSSVRLQDGGSNFIVPGYGNGTHILSTDGGVSSGISIGANAQDGNWHHVAMTWQRNTPDGFRSYLDGQLVASRLSGNTPLPTITNALLGAYNNGSGYSEFTNGSIDEVRIWTVARTQAQIQANMNACGFAAVQPNLTAYYTFDHGTANGSNATVNTLANLAQPGVFNGQLVNFTLSGNSSNWVSPPTQPTILYVNEIATGGNNGLNWTDAYNSLQSALTAANSCSNITQIWVAAGTYKPTSGTDRSISFSMKNGLAIYGGFAGNEIMLSQRNIATNPTILSGDIDGVTDVVSGSGSTLSINGNGNNSYHVISNSGLNNTAVLDGFTITGGSSDYAGGGVYNDGSSPVLTNLIITGNQASAHGGGVFNINNSSPALTNVIITNNVAATGTGGGFANSDFCSPAVLNSIICGNRSGDVGGGIINYSNCFPTFTNSTVANNAGGTGAGMFSFNNNCLPVVTNSIFFGNTTSGNISSIEGAATVTYSDIEQSSGIFTGTGNINANPVFVAANDLHLSTCSPAINTGNGNPSATDFDGLPRIFGGTVDIGAYELQTASTNYTAPAITTNNALNFDGDDYVILSQCNATTPIVNGGDAITVEYWFKGSNLQSAVRLQQENNNYVVPGWTNGTHILSNDGGTGGGLSSGAAATDGNWHHVAMTWLRNTPNTGFTSYLDGAIVAQRSSSDNPLPVINAATLGAYLPNGNNPYEFTNGSVDEVRIWNVARTQAQIQAGFCGSFGPAVQTGLVAYYSFDHGTANGTNTNINTLANLAQPGIFTGGLIGFGLTGTGSNWVSPRTPLVSYPNQIVYVKANAAGTNDGSSWTNAFTSLRSAIAAVNVCSSITQIWVAAGTYRPTTGNDRNISFVMKNNLAIYGGFNGTETTLTARNAATNLTILSGDLLGNDGANFANNSENSYHVIKNSNNGLNSTAILDGFTISGGNASVANTDEGSGGGMYNSSATPAVSNCVFSGNTAINNGGGFEYGSNTNITLTNCSFIGNTAGNGGGISSSSTLTLNNCNFTGNSAINVGGGIIAIGGAALTNCSFSGNNASQGGGMYNSSSTLTNCSFSGNNASQGGGMYNNLFSQTLRNCIIWGNSSGVTNVGGANTTYSYSLIEGINPGGTNFSGSLNPLFVNQPPIGLGTTGNLRLQACSPVLNMGDNAANTSLTDLDGNPRVFGGIIDLGTYELQTSGGGASASIAMANTTQTLTQGPDTYYAPNCTSLIARVQPLSGSGLTPVSGSVAASVWIEPSQPTYNGRPYVLRHYEITPATNPTGVSGIVTLYFTQAELDAFNNYPINGDVYLPQSPADNLGKANLRIIKYSGTSSNGSGLPGTYANNGVEINPNDADIIWNSTLLRWEVSFATTGFSGFIVTNSVSTILPITLSHFSGTCTNGKKTLQWITQSEQNNKGFEVQASADGRSFSSIGFVAGSGNSSIATSYTFSIINKDGFYRLKQLDADGKYNYSPIVQVNCAASATPIFMYPNPAATLVTVTIPIAEGYSSISIYNALGMLVSTKTITNASTTFAVSNLANGHYVVKLSNKNGQVIVKKLIIER